MMDNIMGQQTSLAMMQAQQQKVESLSKMGGQNGPTPEQIEFVAKEFEAVYISEMMKPMFEGIKTDGPFGGGKGEEIFRGILLQEYGKMMAETGQIGIADAVKDELIRMQGMQSGQ